MEVASLPLLPKAEEEAVAPPQVEAEEVEDLPLNLLQEVKVQILGLEEDLGVHH